MLNHNTKNIEQLTFILFLKMADERTKKPFDRESPVPQGYDWPSLLKKDGDELFDVRGSIALRFDDCVRFFKEFDLSDWV